MPETPNRARPTCPDSLCRHCDFWWTLVSFWGSGDEEIMAGHAGECADCNQPSVRVLQSEMQACFLGWKHFACATDHCWRNGASCVTSMKEGFRNLCLFPNRLLQVHLFPLLILLCILFAVINISLSITVSEFHKSQGIIESACGCATPETITLLHPEPEPGFSRLGVDNYFF